MIEVEFNIYTIKDINADQLKCKDQQKCQGDVKISYHQNKTNSIPYDQIIEDVKNQMMDIYKTNVTETKNIFITTIDFNKVSTSNFDYLQGGKWTRNSSMVEFYDSTSFCGCIKPTTNPDIIFTTTILPQPDKCFEEGVLYIGKNITKKSGTKNKKINARECQVQCKNTKKCNLWTFNCEQKFCILMTSKETKARDTEYISGEKDCEPPGRQFQICFNAIEL